jgi:hypothetical protein
MTSVVAGEQIGAPAAARLNWMMKLELACPPAK